MMSESLIRCKETNRLNKLKRIEEYNKSPITCGHCSINISYEKYSEKKSALKRGKIQHIYCNKSCAAFANNKGRNKSNNRKQKVRTCKRCSSNILDTKTGKYCSKECRVLTSPIKFWELVKINGKFPDKCSPGRRRNCLLMFTERKCAICGLDNWFGRPLPVVVDHINGEASDNKLDNLRLVCGNCNMELSTFAGRNRGKGRKQRMKRYYEGKTY